MADIEKTGIIGEIREFCLHDGPGVRTTVFFKGCPLRCPWCHNPEFMPAGTAGGCASVYTAERAAEIILRDRRILEASGGGVTFSGGEVLMQWDFASELADRLDGLHIAVETSGFASEAVYSAMVEKCDLIYQDIKCMDGDLHHRLTGVDNTVILRNIRILQRSGKPYIIRMPWIPGYNDDLLQVKKMVDFLTACPGNLQNVELLPYHAGGIAKLKKLGLPVPPDLPCCDGKVSPEAMAVLAVAHLQKTREIAG